jgi:uncharacterized membrane protein
MTWVLFALTAAVAWGFYGPVLHRGQVPLGHPLRAMMCVGSAYFAAGVLIPALLLASQGELKNFNREGVMWATFAGTLGAAGAVSIIFAFSNGGAPAYVMPLVYGLAPLVNVLSSLFLHPPKESPSPLLFVGFLVTAIGAGMVLYFKPQS